MMPAMKWTQRVNAETITTFSIYSPLTQKVFGKDKQHSGEHDAGDDGAPQRIQRVFHDFLLSLKLSGELLTVLVG
jgi:hypothetical protein